MKTTNPIVRNALEASNAYRNDKGGVHKEWKQRAIATADAIYWSGMEELQKLEAETKRLIGIVRLHGHPKETEAMLDKSEKLEQALAKFLTTSRSIIGV